MEIRHILSCFAVLLSAAAMHASPITYTVTDTASGKLGSASFTNQLVTVSFTGNTANVTGSPGFYTNTIGSGTVQIGTGPAVLFTDSVYFFVNQSYGATGAAGISDTNGSVLDTISNLFETYGGTTAIGPITGPVFYNSGTGFGTANGAFVINSAGANSTFTASTSTTTVTPEPSSILLLGTGLLGTIAVLRRRLQV